MLAGPAIFPIRLNAPRCRSVAGLYFLPYKSAPERTIDLKAAAKSPGATKEWRRWFPLSAAPAKLAEL